MTYIILPNNNKATVPFIYIMYKHIYICLYMYTHMYVYIYIYILSMYIEFSPNLGILLDLEIYIEILYDLIHITNILSPTIVSTRTVKVISQIYTDWLVVSTPLKNND